MKARSTGTRTRSRFESATSVIRVVKVGGSLFDWPQLPTALDGWLNNQLPAINVLLPGGGALVDAIRQASQTFPLDDELTHWLSIDATSINSNVLGHILADAVLISSYCELKSALEAGSPSRIIFDANEFLRDHESHLPGHLLPHDWSVTSDSIAARLAEVLPADDLVLLKSADPLAGTEGRLTDNGFVDGFFSSFDRCHFRQQFVNLRRTVMHPTSAESVTSFG